MNTESLVFLDALTVGSDINLTPLEQLGEMKVYDKCPPEAVTDYCRGISTVVTNKVHFHREVLEQLPDLKLIALTATGYNNVDLAAARERGIAVTNVAGYSTESVVQHTFALLFNLMEQLGRQHHYVASGAYSSQSLFTWLSVPWRELATLTWGIIGLGAIGRRVAEIARVFGAQVVYYSTGGTHNDPDYKRLSLPELLTQSDIISIHAPLNEKTTSLIGEREMKAMKKSAYLLNLGRGGIVDESALAKVLSEGHLGGAALDVMSREPLSPESPLLPLLKDPAAGEPQRLLITPHTAWGSIDARQRVIFETAENIKAFRRGEKRNRIL